MVCFIPVWSFKSRTNKNCPEAHIEHKISLGSSIYMYSRTDIIETPVVWILLILHHLSLGVFCCFYCFLLLPCKAYLERNPLKVDEVMGWQRFDQAIARKNLFKCIQNKIFSVKAAPPPGVVSPWFSVVDIKLHFKRVCRQTWLRRLAQDLDKFVFE